MTRSILHVIYLVEEFFAKGKPRVIVGHPDYGSGSACFILTDSKLTKLKDPVTPKCFRLRLRRTAELPKRIINFLQ